MAKCVYCDGSGILDCSICYRMFSNKNLKSCLYCNWDGQKKCRICDGTGEVENYHCDNSYYCMDPYYQLNDENLDSQYGNVIF